MATKPFDRRDVGSTAAKLFGTTAHSFQFSDQERQAEFAKLVGSRDLKAGEYYGDYAVVNSGEQNVLPDYERVGGYMGRRALSPMFDEQSIRGKESPNFTEDLQIVRRKPAPAPALTPSPAPAPTPQPPAPPVDVTNPSLADALRDLRQQAEEPRRERPALQDALDSALRLGDWQSAGASGEDAADRADSAAAEPEDSGRRFAASDRWRQRLEQVQARFS